MQNRMRFFSCLLGKLFIWMLLLHSLPAMASTYKNCQLKIPPRQAAVTANHGFFFFIYPRAMNETYSGCQTMWDEKGNKGIVLMFDQGSLIKYESKEPLGMQEKLTCPYINGKPGWHDSRDCPDYDDVKDGFQTLPISDEPIVPSSRDPRK